MICQGLRTLFLTQTSITDLVGAGTAARIYVSAARQPATQPYIVLDRVSDEKHKALDGFLSARHCEIDIECWDSTPGDAAALAKIVSDYLDDFTGATGGSETILSSHQMDDTDTYDPPESGSEVKEFVTILNFEFQYTE